MTYVKRDTGMMMVLEEARSRLVEFKHMESKGEHLPDDDLWKSQRRRMWMWARGVCEAGTSHLESKQEIYRKANHKHEEGRAGGMVYSKDKGSAKPGHLHGCNPSYSRRSRSRRISSSKTVWTA